MITSFASADSIQVKDGWQKSGFSTPTGNCVEVAELADGTGIALRNSRAPQGPALVYTKAEFDAFIRGAADGHFNHFLSQS